MKSLAIQSKITLPADVSKSDAETFGKLSKLSGAQFDKAYANEMVKDRERRSGISEGSDERQRSIAEGICVQDAANVAIAFAASAGNAQDGSGFLGKVEATQPLLV